VIVTFFGLLAKGARTAIIPTAPSQTIRHPNPILQSEPSVVLGLWGGPSFPNNLVDARVNKPKKL
jgi:hypothetical protein